jgi:hypothetical protein
LEESLRGHREVIAQITAPLDRHMIEPMVVEEFMSMSINVHAITSFRCSDV